MVIGVLLFSAFILTALGIYLFKRIASRVDLLLDIPNERSSHVAPVIRGAGAVIVLIVLGLYIVSSGSEANIIFVCVAILVAATGFIDDLFSLPFWPRLIVHVVAASILVYSAGSFEELRIPLTTITVPLGPAGPALLVFFIVGTTNAFNFMDGIDGIAGLQGIAAAFGWVLFGLTSDQMPFVLVGAIIFGACAGFLIFNWQPARVFMGDVGSTFLGFTLASLPLIDRSRTLVSMSDVFFLSGAFLWLFLFDSAFTRIKRIISGKPFWKPHKDHLYQRLTSAGNSHRVVALYYGVCALIISLAAVYLLEIGLLAMFAVIIAPTVALLFWAGKNRLT